MDSEGKDPSSFLSEIIGAPVTVKLNSGVIYKGIIPLALMSLKSYNSKGSYNPWMAI